MPFCAVGVGNFGYDLGMWGGEGLSEKDYGCSGMAQTVSRGRHREISMHYRVHPGALEPKIF